MDVVDNLLKISYFLMVIELAPQL